MPSNTQQPVLRSVTPADGPDRIIEIIKEDGCVVIKGMLTLDQVRQINNDLDSALAKVGVGSESSDEWVKEFHGNNTKRMTNLATISKTFREALLDHDLFHSVNDKVFYDESGTWWLNTAQAIEIGPGSQAQMLHRDQSQFSVFTLLGPNGPEATINWFLALTKFTDENGATRVIPGSHKWVDFTDNGTLEDTIPAEIEAGDIFLFSGKLVHGGGANRTVDFWRRAISTSSICSYLTPEEAYPFLLDLDLVKTMSPRVQRILAFRSQKPKDSPGLWQSDYREIANVLGL